MAYRRKSYTYWDGDAIFPIPFEYLEQDDILVFINEEQTTDFVIENTQVKLNNKPLEVPAIIKIVSATDIDKAAVEWENVSSLDEDNLILSDNQIRYAVQELYDNTEQFKTDTQEDFQEFREEIHTLLDDVSEAAELISSTIEAVDTAVLTTQEQALIATEQKELATEQANIAIAQTELVASTANKALDDIETLATNSEQAIETLSATSTEEISVLKNDSIAELNTLGNTIKSDATDWIDAINATGKSYKMVTHRQITNCITEIPQDIKLELEPLNANMVGSVTNNVGVISGFSTSNYLTLPKTFNTGQNWEIVFKVMVAESQYTYQCLLGYSNVMAFCIKTTTDGKVVHFNLGDGSTWASGCNGTEKLIVGETYWLKASKVGNVTTVQHSIDNQTWITDGTLETSLTSQAQLWIGNINSTNQQFYGSIDLPNCYIKTNNSIWWQGGTGALTLKAGSKVYKPDSTEINIERDYSITATYADGILFYDIDNDRFYWRQKSECYSQNTAPTATQYMLWYDTSNNSIKATADTGATWAECSLPVGTFTANATQITSIDQIFNGFGYIGSTVFALPNIKGLIPNGRNADGTLNNIELISRRVVTRNITWSCEKGQKVALRINDTGLDSTTSVAYYYQQEQEPNIQHHAYWYKPSVNKLYRRSGTESWYEFNAVVVGEWFNTGENTNISSFNTPQPFRAVDYSEFNAIPHIVETYQNGTSGYIVYSNGYCEQWGRVNINFTANRYNDYTITLLKPYKNTDYNILAFAMDRGDIHNSNIAYSTITSTNWVLRAYGVQTQNNKTACWRTCGYIA